jgi:O-antigen/teichoic acid export membrane protein
MVVSQIIASFLLYVRSNISGMLLFRTDSIISVFDKLLMIMVCGWLLWGPLRNRFTIEWFIYAQIASLTVTLVAASLIALLHSPERKARWNFSGIKAIVKKTYPYALLGLLMSIYYRLDGVMLERMLPDGKSEAGIYAASFRLLDTANMLGFLFATILLPMFARMLSEKQDVHPLASSGFKAIMTAAMPAVTVCFFYRHEIIHLLYHDSSPYWADVFGLLMPSFPGVCTVYIYGSLLTANGSMKALNSIALGGMLLNVILNFILIPQYKAAGATVATLITQTLVALAHIYAVKKILPFAINYRHLMAFLLFCAAMQAVFFITRETTDFWALNALLAVGISIILSAWFGIIDFGRVIALMKNRGK